MKLYHVKVQLKVTLLRRIGMFAEGESSEVEHEHAVVAEDEASAMQTIRNTVAARSYTASHEIVTISAEPVEKGWLQIV